MYLCIDIYLYICDIYIQKQQFEIGCTTCDISMVIHGYMELVGNSKFHLPCTSHGLTLQQFGSLGVSFWSTVGARKPQGRPFGSREPPGTTWEQIVSEYNLCHVGVVSGSFGRSLSHLGAPKNHLGTSWQSLGEVSAPS